MKKTLLPLLFLCCLFNARTSAQTEFSQTGMQWKTNYSSIGGYKGKYINVDYQYELGSDTLIENKHCKKIYQDETLAGAFLEEERKVWYYPFSDNEDTPRRVLLYDFSKEKGEKIESYLISWNTGGSLASLDFGIPATLIVEDVRYEHGRKIMTISTEDQWSMGMDVWIEGIGSPWGFWGCYLQVPTDGSSTSTNLMQAVAPDKTTLYYKHQLLIPNYQSTFLKEGKTWEVLNHKTNKIEKTTIGSSKMINNYLCYRVSSPVQTGYLYDVNGNIYFMFNRPDGLGPELSCDHLLYNFNLSTGNNISLCTSASFWQDMQPSYTTYIVTETKNIEYKGQTLKKIILEGDITHTWLENVGSLNTPLHVHWNYLQEKLPEYQLLRCYIGDHIIYDSSDFPNGIVENTANAPTYTVTNETLIIRNGEGYSLSLYDISGQEVYQQKVTNAIHTTPLSSLPTPWLIARLQKRNNPVISFKVADIK